MPPKRNFAVDNCEWLMTCDRQTFHSLLRVVPCVPSDAPQRIQRAQVSKIKADINCWPIDILHGFSQHGQKNFQIVL
jgi:hypothetical protein